MRNPNYGYNSIRSTSFCPFSKTSVLWTDRQFIRPTGQPYRAEFTPRSSAGNHTECSLGKGGYSDKGSGPAETQADLCHILLADGPGSGAGWAGELGANDQSSLGGVHPGRDLHHRSGILLPSRERELEIATLAVFRKSFEPPADCLHRFSWDANTGLRSGNDPILTTD